MQSLTASEQVKLAKKYGIDGIVLLIANAIENAIEYPKEGEEESFEKLKEFIIEEDNFNKLVDLAERVWLRIDIEHADGFIENIIDSIRKLLFVRNIPIETVFARDVIWELEL